MPDDNPSLEVLAQSACRHLLSKGMYVTGQLNPADDPYQPMSDGYCWCNLTQHALGPDDRLVDRESCIQGRSCYEPR
jgi:hypothetical protein